MTMVRDRPVRIGDRSFTLRLDVEAIIALERELGSPWHKIQAKLAAGDGGMLEIRALAWASLLRHHAMTIDEVTTLIEAEGAPAIMVALADDREEPAVRPTDATKTKSRPRNRPGTGEGSSSRGAKRA